MEHSKHKIPLFKYILFYCSSKQSIQHHFLKILSIFVVFHSEFFQKFKTESNFLKIESLDLPTQTFFTMIFCFFLNYLGISQLPCNYFSLTSGKINSKRRGQAFSWKIRLDPIFHFLFSCCDKTLKHCLGTTIQSLLKHSFCFSHR